MPELSPRRSSRARAVQPPPNKLTHTNSSSSASSARGERSSKPTDKRELGTASPSERSQELSQVEQETRNTRRSKREQIPTSDHHTPVAEEVVEDEEGEEDITRCLCGKPEYPGPPPALGISDPDVGGMFIQCDNCHVWQHGGCVGIMNDDETPDDYFCEQCRPGLHRVFNGGRAQKYSRYLPVVEARASSPTRKKPALKESENRASKENDPKNVVLSANGKRRATMNSRAAYEEDEMLRRALEESKGGGTTESSTSGQRKGKRAREDSDDSDHDLKRLKTGSESPPESSAIAGDADSETEASRQRSNNSVSKLRPGKSQQELERDFKRREREREQERQAAANRRKGRADRRHADDPETVLESTRPIGPSKAPTAGTLKSTKSQTSMRQQNVSPQRGPSISHKKGARPARRGKVGRNQYTRDRDAAADARAEAARSLHSRDGEDGGGGDGHGQLLPNGSKPAKPKHMNPNRTSMNELRKRAAGVLEYISRTQVEMAGERTSSSSHTPTKGATRASAGKAMGMNGASKLSNEVQGDTETSNQEPASHTSGTDVKVGVADFKELSSLQMMDVLTRELVHWQQDHGKWGEK